MTGRELYEQCRGWMRRRRSAFTTPRRQAVVLQFPDKKEEVD